MLYQRVAVDQLRALGSQLVKSAETRTGALVGTLQLSRTGWLLVSVPNAIVRGAFDALQEPGIELPPGQRLNAHISVMRPDEVESVGGPGAISERGHVYRYNLGEVREVVPAGWGDMSRVWFFEVRSRELEELRRSYGLSSQPKYPFHLTIAVRRKHVLRTNEVRKQADDGMVGRIRKVLNGFSQQELSGVRVYCTEDRIWLDLMDWADDKVGKFLTSALAKLVGDGALEVVNEGMPPAGFQKVADITSGLVGLWRKGAAPPSPVNSYGQDTETVGQLYQELVRRGLLHGNSPQTVQAWLAPVTAVKQMLASTGEKEPSMDRVFEMMHALTQGVPQLTPGALTMAVRRTYELAKATPGGLPRYLNFLGRGTEVANSMELNPHFGAESAQHAMAFGEAFGRQMGPQGFGGLSKDQATAVNQQLYLAAANSGAANSMASLLSMLEDGQLHGAAKDLAEKIKAHDATAIEFLARSSPRTVYDIAARSLEERGINPSVVNSYFGARQANQAVIARHGLAGIARKMQGPGEVAAMIRSGLQGGLSGFEHLTPDKQRVVSEAMHRKLVGMAGSDILFDPAKREERTRQLVEAIREADPTFTDPAQLSAAANSAVRGVEGLIGQSPALKRFGNLAGLINLHYGPHAATDRLIRGADQHAGAAELMAPIGGGTTTQRFVDAVGSNRGLGSILGTVFGQVPKEQIDAVAPAVATLPRPGAIS